MYVEYFADSIDGLHWRFDDLQRTFSSHTIIRHVDPIAMQQAWTLRRSGEPLLHGLHGPRKPLTFIEDLAVDPERLVDFIREFRSIIAKYHTTAAYYAHASVGCLHIRPMIDLRDANDRDVMQRIMEEATDLVSRYGGALSGEHGDGRVRSHLLERYFGPDICGAFAAIKAIFDPGNRLNPGIIVNPAPMLQHTRVQPLEQLVSVPTVKTFFRYDCEHGFDEAVHMCNGAGVCRKMKGGTMCPSYRATLDERHATRGRGNALRLAITGQFSTDGTSPSWNDPGTLQTLDLCLSCKACKRECPSNVDVAKLKAEYLAQGYEASRVPLASRVFANIRTINRIGSAIHPIANAIGAIPFVKRMMDRTLGLHANRRLPRFERSLHHWMKSRIENTANVRHARPCVVLFADCFTTYNETRIGRAAVAVLEKLGYRVVIPRTGCCGRAAISTGVLRQAVTTCRATASQLLQCIEAENAIAVLGCEPSCLSAMKDEWLELELGMDAAPLRKLADKAWLVEQFVEARWHEHPNNNAQSFRPPRSRHILHGHCHQKALWGLESSSAVLQRMLGNTLTVLDSGCCGMAGSFGYAWNHYDISMKIAEQSLFGTLREAPDAVIIAPGTSCRQQIRDGLSREALHPIEVLAQAIG